MNKEHAAQTQEAIKRFHGYCKEKEMRYTLERETIIKEIYRFESHFAVDDLFVKVRSHNPKSKIAKTSIYRSLPFFLDAGLLRESVTGMGCVIYEHTLGHKDHDHFRCVRCGRIVEFRSPELIATMKRICRKERFTVLSRTNVVNGYCLHCRGKAAKGR